MLRKPVQLVRRHIHERGHLVDERARAAGAGAVHALFQRAAKEDDLGVLAAQLDHSVRAGQEGLHGLGGGVDLLHKGNTGGLGHAEARRTRDSYADRVAIHDRLCAL